jgi:hypothetical protein
MKQGALAAGAIGEVGGLPRQRAALRLFLGGEGLYAGKLAVDELPRNRLQVSNTKPRGEAHSLLQGRAF